MNEYTEALTMICVGLASASLTLIALSVGGLL